MCDDPERFYRRFDDNPVRFSKRFDDDPERFCRRFERSERCPIVRASLLSF